MSLTINSNQSASIANRALTNVSRAMDRALARLSSGQTAPSARFDATAVAIASRIRGELGALSAQKNNATQAISMFQVAEGVYQRTNDMLTRMRSLAAQAQSSNLSATERGMLDTEYQQLKREVTRLAQGTTFNGTSLFASGAFALDAAVTQNTNTYFDSAVADFNGDGYADYATIDAAGLFEVRNGLGDGTFSAVATSTNYGSSGNNWLRTGDFNGDGVTDILYQSGNITRILQNNGRGTFSVVTTQTTDSTYVSQCVQIADFNNDGRDDIAFAGDTMFAVYRNNGAGFTLAATLTNNLGDASCITVGDVNNDGAIDIVLAGLTDSRVVSYINNGSGTGFTAGTASGFAGTEVSWAMQLADMNNDGRLDIVTTDRNNNGVYVRYNNGTSWSAATTLNMGVGVFAIDDIVVEDIDGDGFKDIILAGNGVNTIIRGRTNTTFYDYETLGDFSKHGQRIFAVDLTRDGRRDILIQDNGSTQVATAINRTVMGLEGNVRVGANAAASNNIAYRIGSIALAALDSDLAYSAINTLGGAGRAEDSILRAQNLLTRYRTALGAGVNRLEKVIDNVATMYENQEGARSAYMDLDVASEMAQFTAQKVTMQAGISMLSQAGSSQRLIAQLLQGGGLN